MMNSARPVETSRVVLGNATPILRVADLAQSLTYYCDRLGFAVDFRDGLFAQVGRDRAHIMLCEGDQGSPRTWLYVGVDDADALHTELQTRGAQVRHPPTNYPWGARELQVSDPDGHVLRFGSDATAEPTGVWLDGAGRRWMPNPDGSWRAAE